jgi:hypothetical protein
MTEYRGPKRCRGCGEWFEPAKAYYHTCPECFGGEPLESAVRLVPVLDTATIKAALALAHPDVHPPERQRRAHDVSTKLAAALERTRELERAA